MVKPAADQDLGTAGHRATSPLPEPCRVTAQTHLLVCHRDEALLGELPQSVEVCPHVQLAADQHNLRVGAELLRFPLPLQRKREALVCMAFPNRVSQLFKH